MNCVQALLSAAAGETNADKHYTLRGAAQLLQAAIAEFQEQPTLENLRELNGAWAYANRVLRAVTPDPEPDEQRSIA